MYVMYAALFLLFLEVPLAVADPSDSFVMHGIVHNLQGRQFTGNCNETDVLNYIYNFSNVRECINPDVSFNSSYCKRDCHQIYLGLGEHCMDKQLILQYKVLCGKFNNSYCLDILSDVDSQAIISETIAICGENDTVSCSPKCASLLEGLLENVGCCYNNYFNHSVLNSSLDRGENVATNSYELWKACNVETPGFCMLTDHDATPPPAETPGATTDEPATTPGGTATTDNGSSTVETSPLFAAEVFIMTLYFTNTIIGSE